MQKHLRSVHEDRADQWKSPGFVNGLVTIGDRPLRGAGSSKSTKSKPQQAQSKNPNDDNDDFDSDTNNNLNRSHDDPSKKRKAGSSGAKKRTKKDQYDMCDEIDSSSPMILPGDDISAPMFNQHRHLPNNAASNSNYMLYDGENARSSLIQSNHLHQQLQHPDQHGGFNGSHKQLDRFHQTLENLEIDESSGMLNGQLTMISSNVVGGTAVGTTSTGLANGVQHSQPHQVQHLQTHSQHGLISWGDRLTAVQTNPTANVTAMTPLTTASGTSTVSGASVTTGEGGGDGGGGVDGDENGYGHFYEDYMVL